MPKEKEKKQDIECFVIMPISNQKDYDDGHFTLVYEDIIKPAIKACKMIAVRADETKNTNLIQLDILKRIIETPIAICDMSSKNPNVFYELGMRQAFDMPTVLIKDEDTHAPFDISGLRYVTYNKNMKHREVMSAINELTECLKDTYHKRNDKTEINSLIRLMEFRSPAKLIPIDISENEKLERLQELEILDLKQNMKDMMKMQSKILSKINNSSHENTMNRYRNLSIKDKLLERKQEREHFYSQLKARLEDGDFIIDDDIDFKIE